MGSIKQAVFKRAKNKRFKNLANNEALIKSALTSRLLLNVFFNNVNHILAERKLTYYKIIKHYKQAGLNLDKGYLSRLNNGKLNTCNTLILAFISNYLNIPLLELLTKDFTNDKINILDTGNDDNLNDF